MKTISIKVSSRVAKRLDLLTHKTGASCSQILWIAVEALLSSIDDDWVIETIKQEVTK